MRHGRCVMSNFTRRPFTPADFARIILLTDNRADFARIERHLRGFRSEQPWSTL